MGRKLCGCCGEIKDSKEFYKSPKIKEEYIFLCKNCCGQKLKEYENILDKKSAAFWLVLSEIGIPFISEIWKIVETYPSAGRKKKDYLLLYLKTLIEDGRLVNGFWESDVMLDDLIQIKKDEIVPKQELNLEEERKRLEVEKLRLEGEVARCEKMLSNPGFVNKAPEAKVKEEKEKLEKYKKMLEKVMESLN